MMYRESRMMRMSFSARVSPASSTSKAHRAANPQASTVNTKARKSGRYSESNGQLMKTLVLKVGRARRSRAIAILGAACLALFHETAVTDLNDRPANQLGVDQTPFAWRD